LPVYKPTGDDDDDEILSNKCGEGLLFIDELSRATDQVLNVILPLINEGEFNGYKVGKKWTIMVASNRMEDDKGQNELGTALSNRFIQYHYEPTVESWMEWARKQNYMSPVILNWLEMGTDKGGQYSGKKFFYWDPNDGDPDNPSTLMCTPCSWTNALQYLSTFVKTQADYDAGTEFGDLTGYKIFDLPQDVIREALNSALPHAAVEAFMSFYKIIDAVGDLERICTSIWKTGKSPKMSKSDFSAIQLPLAQIVVNSHANSLPTTKELENLMSWAASMDSESLASYLADLVVATFFPEAKKGTQAYDNFYVFKYAEQVEELDKNELKLLQTMYKPFLSKWGVSWAKAPDYHTAIDIIVDKYGDVFGSFSIGHHKNALG
jgi:hypothetical protein